MASNYYFSFVFSNPFTMKVCMNLRLVIQHNDGTLDNYYLSLTFNFCELFHQVLVFVLCVFHTMFILCKQLIQDIYCVCNFEKVKSQHAWLSASTIVLPWDIFGFLLLVWQEMPFYLQCGPITEYFHVDCTGELKVFLNNVPRIMYQENTKFLIEVFFLYTFNKQD